MIKINLVCQFFRQNLWVLYRNDCANHKFTKIIKAVHMNATIFVSQIDD